MVRIISYLFLLAMLLVVLVFAVLNAGPVQLNYYFGTFNVPLSWAVVIAMLVGTVIGVLASLGVILRMRREVSRIRRTAQLNEKELRNLRSIPIRDKH